jgi:hypothetical protein
VMQVEPLSARGGTGANLFRRFTIQRDPRKRVRAGQRLSDRVGFHNSATVGQRAQRSGLLEGAVRAVGVVEVLVLAQDGHQVPLVPDQGPVQELSPAAADPALSR